MKLSLERKIVLGFGASVLVLLLVAGAAVWNVRWLQGTFYWVDHTHGVLNRLESALSDVLSMQTSTRGFVLTGNDDLLAPHRRGEEHLPRVFAELRSLVADNPPQAARLKTLEEQAARARTVMTERIAARRARGLSAAADAPAFLAGQQAVEALRATVEEMKAEEERRLDGRFLRARQAARYTVLTIVSASTLTVALVGLAAYFVRRDFIRRHEAELERDRFFTVSRDLLCTAGFDGYFKRLNPAWQETLGYPAEELLAQPFIELVHPDDREETEAMARQLVDGQDVSSFRNRYRCRDGSYRWLVWSARALPEEQLIIASARDITARKEAEDRVQRLNIDLEVRAQQLESANGELEAFSYSVSHDLRAPLRHINGFASLLAKRSEKVLDAEGQRYLATISRAAKQMGALIDDLLAFSRIGRTPLKLQRVNLDELVAGVIADGRYGSAERPIKWELAPLPTVSADPAMLRQVWVNLIDNAVKYSGKSPAPRVTIGSALDPASDRYVFSVRDNGVGFDMAYADKLFGVFQRLHDPGDFEGTGIGLANVRRIVTRHGGRTWAEGRPGEGATFHFSLPAHPSPRAGQ